MTRRARAGVILLGLFFAWPVHLAPSCQDLFEGRAVA